MPYNYITYNQELLENGIVSCSYFPTNLQEVYGETIVDKEQYFGNSENDVVEFSLYNSNQDFLEFNTIVPNTTFSVLQGNYTDINNEEQSYNVITPITNYAKYDNNILLNVQEQITATGVGTGLYYGLYNFIRNIAGFPEKTLIIKEISPSRTELKLSLNFNADDSDENRLAYSRIAGFSQKKYLFLQISKNLISQIEKNPIEENFSNYKSPATKKSVYQNLGLQNESELQEFINNTYTGFDRLIKQYEQDSDEVIIEELVKLDGVRQQLINFIYKYNDIPFSEQDIIDAFKTITTKISQERILQKTTLNQKDLDEAVGLFVDVIFSQSLENSISNLLSQYYVRFFGLYKNVINFGNGAYVKILNHSSYINPSTGLVNLQVKLDSPLPTNFSIRDTCWISNTSVAPLYFKINVFAKNISRKVFLNGVNFDVDVDVSEISSEDFSTNEARSLEKSKEDLKLKLNDLYIDYTDFNNFIIYSSAELRSKIAKNKISEFDAITKNKGLLKNSIENASTAMISSSLSDDYTNMLQSQINLLDSFDEYESYLFFNSASVNINEKILDGVEYDKQNLDSLLSQLPEYIVSDADSSEYLIFTSMVGHFFDNILSYITKFPKTYPLNNDPNAFPYQYIDELLNSFNWNTLNFKFQDSSKDQWLLNSQENSSSLSSSYYDYGKSILNRIANNLPNIYKTKGSATSIELVRSIFGIDSSLINVKEYGSFGSFTTKDQFYDFEDIQYFTKIEDDQYIKFEYDFEEYEYEFNGTFSSSAAAASTSSYVERFSGINSCELSFKIPSNPYDFQDKITIFKKLRNNHIDWQIYLKKERSEKSGKLIFELTPPEAGITSSISSEELPFFNGNIYTVLISRKFLDGYKYDTLSQTTGSVGGELFISQSNSNKYVPNEYTLQVNQYEGELKNFQSKTSKRILYPQNQFFSSGSYYVGNFQPNSQFKGNIDKIKIFKNTVSDEIFNEHSYNLGSISINDKDELYENLCYLWSFDTPVNLWDVSGSNVVTVQNQNPYYTSSFDAHNFKGTVEVNYPDCTPSIVSKFPYQFETLKIKQALNISKYGPNYKNNLKIEKINEFADTTLTPYDNSTKTYDFTGNDSNVVGFYISPYKYLENKIEDFLGENGIVNDIGDPKYINDSEFISLKEKQKQFASLNRKYVYPQESYSTYKFYIDFSIFEQIKKLVPSRSSLKRGLLLEASSLEKPRFKYASLNINNDNVLSQSFINFDVSSKISQSLYDIDQTSTDIDITYINDFSPETTTNHFYNLQIPDTLDVRDFIYSKYGKNISINEDGVVLRDINFLNLNEYYSFRSDDGSNVVFTSSFNKIEEIGSGSLTGSSTFDLVYTGDFDSGYSKRHLSKIILAGRRERYNALRVVNNNTERYVYIKGQNTIDTTVDRNGDANYTEPVIRIDGYLNMEISASTFPANGYVTGSNTFVKTPITASLINSSSLDTWIHNL